ncbi:class A beta-lactamase-related serine hydrolase [Brevibacillus humidisoli]|uniref:serine hydrolase n=1 Tax=Brevibacillus humidisoli TaxID=2895522 RepID=UPI001E5DA5F8|nr:serine hydrolase [Brevibacillus humidisoli]UFJ41828.1 class A beta-lactamase-related serine hydrolase [Brevibacillus humidisoli]
MKQMEQVLLPLLEQTGGSWGIVIEDLDREQQWSHNENERFAAESIIKLPIMAAVFAAAESGQIRLSDKLILQREQLVGGSGVLQHLTPGLQLSVYDLVTLMIIQSDNTATNILIDLVGKEQIEQTMKELGMLDSRYLRKLMIYPAAIDEPNTITAHDISRLLAHLAKGTYLSRHACLQMMEIMKRQQFRNGLPAYLPVEAEPFVGRSPLWQLANKTGWDTGRQHDVGIFFIGGRTISVTALSRDLDPPVALDTLARIGQAVYRYAQT